MRKMVCSVCGYVYDKTKGIPEAGIAPETEWDDLSPDWVCPLCGANKGVFTEPDKVTHQMNRSFVPHTTGEALTELSPLQVSALCSNLARGCEKQYKLKEAALFQELSDYFKRSAPPAIRPRLDKVLRLVDKDLQSSIPAANIAASNAKDRGALRALTWNEKVSRILKSLLKRFGESDSSLPDGTGVYVCLICGFVYVGYDSPTQCPVCKAPAAKIEKVEGRAS